MESEKRITAKQIMERFACGERPPTNSEIDEDYPDTAAELVEIIYDYWLAIDAVTDAKYWIKNMAEKE